MSAWEVPPPGVCLAGTSDRGMQRERPGRHAVRDVFLLVAGAGVEPATYRFSGDRSYQLSYPAARFHVKPQRS